jgi:HD-GYP domain-containing protein (c-di-GMP phosphodiesterase class II)
MTPEDIKAYESHPTRSRDILFHVPSTPEEVVLASYQHHERINGLGYPTQSQRNKIHPFARIIGLVDEFCHLVLRGPYGTGMEPKDAIAAIYPAKALEFDGFFIRALYQTLQLPVPDKLKNITIANDVRIGN